jgi:hypothetical protein
MNIKELAKFRRTENPSWQCGYCNKLFLTEDGFMSHICSARERLDELRSINGQIAYQYYTEWMKYNKRKAPSIETFASSRYFRSFINFVEHVNKLKIPDPLAFIKLMVEKDISPMLWRRDQCYTLFLHYYDKNVDPLEQVALSIETLIDISNKNNIDLKNIFEYLGIKRIMELIRLRKLSPWLIFCSKSCGDFLHTLNKEDMQELSQLINPTYWSEKLQINEEIVKDISKICDEVGL